MQTEPVVRVRNATKQFPRPAGTPFPALTDISLDVKPGEFVAVVGKSGSGKSTLLNLMAGLDRPTTGEVTVAGASLGGLSENALAAWRGRNVGVVFQFFQLLPTLSALDNVLLAMDFVGVIPRNERRDRACHLLGQVGIADHKDKLPGTLSGGEQQRAAIARALANNPPLLIADEPTGNLDSRNAEAVLGVFAGQVAGGTTLIVVTHDEAVAGRAARSIRLADGRMVGDTTA